MTNEMIAGAKVEFIPGANVSGDLLTEKWIIEKVGTKEGFPAAILIGTDYYGRHRRFAAKLSVLRIAK